jgi:hypothetical protein
MYPSVNAQQNWWGGSKLSYVAGRIWERRDDDNLIQVDYDQYIQDNTTILSGKAFYGLVQTIGLILEFYHITFTLHFMATCMLFDCRTTFIS